MGTSGTFRRLVKPIAKRLIYSTLQPVGPTKHVLSGLAHVGFYAREAFEWGRRSVVATRISIGKYASIAGGCYIADTEGHSHYNPQKPIWEVPAGDGDVGPVTIEDGVQISRNCMILKGVTIGARSVIGAGSVVRSDIPADSIVMGNPARVVKKMTPP